jgi:hypothetical protein
MAQQMANSVMMFRIAWASQLMLLPELTSFVRQQVRVASALLIRVDLSRH